MKQVVLSVLLLMSFVGAMNAQMLGYDRKRASDGFCTIDTSHLVVSYDYYFKDKNGKEYHDIKSVEYGNRVIKYSTLIGWRMDTLDSRMSKTETSYNPYEMLGLSENDFPDREDEYFNWPEADRLTVTNLICDNELYYEEPVPFMEWAVQAETDTIAGYFCQSAQTVFRGRTYTVFFTVDIPIGTGLWKFNGVPGLIMYAYDEDWNFCWKVRSISRSGTVPILLAQDRKKHRCSSMSEYKNLSDKLLRDPLGTYIESYANKFTQIDRFGNVSTISHEEINSIFLSIMPELYEKEIIENR